MDWFLYDTDLRHERINDVRVFSFRYENTASQNKPI